jgi:adenylate cyclase
MASEIERKFLVEGDFRSASTHRVKIVQGYLSSVPERSVRVRIMGDKAWLNVKGIGNSTGTTRFEWEKEITVKDAEELIKICEPGLIEKVRYFVPFKDRTFEVDEFLGENSGLIVAEIELSSEGEPFEKPIWIGREVTGDTKYYNAMLMKKPYSRWEK